MDPALPPLPKSLSGMLSADNQDIREVEKVHQLKNLIPDMNGNTSNSGNNPRSAGVACEVLKESPGLQSSLAHLRNEMMSLRQQDMSLLCQLWSLNESLQELKLALRDRSSDTNSECSSYSLDTNLDMNPIIEEDHDHDHEYENEMFHSHKYENEMFHDKESKDTVEEDNIYEPVYIETHSKSSSDKK